MAIIRSISGVAGRKLYTNTDNKTSLLFMISCDIQFVIGLALYFGNSWFDKFKDHENMKISGIRFFMLEHAAMMVAAWILVHVGRVIIKRTLADQAKHKKTLIFFGLAIIIIIAAIPWPFREAIARPLLRWLS